MRGVWWHVVQQRSAARSRAVFVDGGLNSSMGWVMRRLRAGGARVEDFMCCVKRCRSGAAGTGRSACVWLHHEAFQAADCEQVRGHEGHVKCMWCCSTT